jgi:hypothetical protein
LLEKDKNNDRINSKRDVKNKSPMIERGLRERAID